MVSRTAPSASVGNAAARRITGFSPDGTFFAFEQYGPVLFGGVKVDWTSAVHRFTETPNRPISLI